MATKKKAATKKVASGDPEAINDPERELGADEMRRRDELEDRQEIAISTFNPVTHQELLINFTGLPPETDFEVKISGDIPQNYWATLKSDPWGQAQLIWRTPVGGKYKISGKGGTGDHKVNVSESFEVAALDADEDYRREKRKNRRRPVGGNVQTVEEPGVMGDKPSGEERYQPTEEEADDPQLYDPAFKTAEHDPEDQGDPAINKEPHPEGSPQFNYRHPGEAETMGTESKEDPDSDDKAAKKAIKNETKRARKAREKGSGEVSEMAGMSEPKSQEEIDRENAHTGADEADR
jgi:hypothetical protein